MAKKRGHGEGSIRKRKDGKWEARATVGHTPEGKPRRVSKYFKTRKAAQDWLAQVAHEMHTGMFTEPAKITLGEWLGRWLETYQKNRVAVTTYELYEMLIRLHIGPAVGNIELSKLRPVDLQRLYIEKLQHGRVDGQGGLSEQTVRHIHNILHNSLNQAVKEGLLYRNPADATTPPKVPKREISPISKDQAQRFLESIKSDRLYAAFSLVLGTGLRRGEILGLKWDDVNFDKGTITVRRILVRARQDGGKTKTALIFKEPKTVKSRRTIPLPAVVIRDLKRHRQRQNEEKLLLGATYQDNGLVFATADGRPVDPRNFIRRYTNLLKKAGIEHSRFHNWRHAFATILLELNAHPKVVQEMLGHSKIAQTLDTYSHVVPGLMEQAAAKLNSVLKEKPSKTEGQTP